MKSLVSHPIDAPNSPAITIVPSGPQVPQHGPADYYETVKAWRPRDHAQHHSAVDLEKETFQNSLVQRSHSCRYRFASFDQPICETAASS
jgi:hypothetical protein